MNASFPTRAYAPPTTGPNNVPPAHGDTPNTPEEAATAFEKVLVRRFVKSMTENMFKTTLSGEDGPSWIKGQRDRQRDVFTDVLADHIVDTNTLGIADILLRDWGMTPEADASAPSDDDLPALQETVPAPHKMPFERLIHKMPFERPHRIAAQAD